MGGDAVTRRAPESVHTPTGMIQRDEGATHRALQPFVLDGIGYMACDEVRLGADDVVVFPASPSPYFHRAIELLGLLEERDLVDAVLARRDQRIDEQSLKLNREGLEARGYVRSLDAPVIVEAPRETQAQIDARSMAEERVRHEASLRATRLHNEASSVYADALKEALGQ